MTPTLRALVALIAVLPMSCLAGNVEAASFSIVYDDTVTRAIDGNIVGTGTFSYDGPPVVGSFALSSLTGVSFTADFPSFPATFLTGDLVSDFNISGIHVFDAGGGQFGLVFSGGSIVLGSLNAINADNVLLSHEPTPAINNPIGCCGGNGTINLHLLSDVDTGSLHFGDYQGVTAAGVPAPASLVLLGLGLSGIGAVRARRRR